MIGGIVGFATIGWWGYHGLCLVAKISVQRFQCLFIFLLGRTITKISQVTFLLCWTETTDQSMFNKTCWEDWPLSLFDQCLSTEKGARWNRWSVAIVLFEDLKGVWQGFKEPKEWIAATPRFQGARTFGPWPPYDLLDATRILCCKQCHNDLYPLVMTNSSPWLSHGPNRNRCFTVLKNGWIFHGKPRW